MQGDFTLSYHYFRQRDSRNHLELFLDLDGTSPLQTWQSFGKSPRQRRFKAAPDHRRDYLTFAGPVSDDRGKLRILRKGKFIDRRTGRPRSSGGMDASLTDDRRTRRDDTIRVSL